MEMKINDNDGEGDKDGDGNSDDKKLWLSYSRRAIFYSTSQV